MPNYADSSFPGLIYQSWACDNTAATRGHGFLCYKVVVFALLLNFGPDQKMFWTLLRKSFEGKKVFEDKQTLDGSGTLTF